MQTTDYKIKSMFCHLSLFRSYIFYDNVLRVCPVNGYTWQCRNILSDHMFVPYTNNPKARHITEHRHNIIYVVGTVVRDHLIMLLPGGCCHTVY